MYQSHRDEERNQDSFDWSSGCDHDDATGAASFTSLRQLIAPRELPEAGSLPDTELIALLNELEFDLLQNKVRVDFLDTLPARVAYKGLLQMMDSPIALADDAILHLDGCDSACESCFQLAHCAVAREVLGTSDWRMAVDQAGVNPSWSALFGAGT